MLQIRSHRKFIHVTIHPCGRANCNSPLRVCYPNVGKYYIQIASRAWYEDVCVRRRGELKFAHTTIRPCCNSSILQFIHIAKFMLQIHPCFQLTIIGGRIAHNGWANCPQWMGELQFAPTRVLSERWQISCKYLNTCKLMIECIYIPT